MRFFVVFLNKPRLPSKESIFTWILWLLDTRKDGVLIGDPVIRVVFELMSWSQTQQDHSIIRDFLHVMDQLEEILDQLPSLKN